MHPIHNLPHYFRKIHFDIIFPSTWRSAERSPASRFSDQKHCQHHDSMCRLQSQIPFWLSIRVCLLFCSVYLSPVRLDAKHMPRSTWWSCNSWWRHNAVLTSFDQIFNLDAQCHSLLNDIFLASFHSSGIKHWEDSSSLQGAVIG